MSAERTEERVSGLSALGRPCPGGRVGRPVSLAQVHPPSHREWHTGTQTRLPARSIFPRFPPEDLILPILPPRRWAGKRGTNVLYQRCIHIHGSYQGVASDTSRQAWHPGSRLPPLPNGLGVQDIRGRCTEP